MPPDLTMPYDDLQPPEKTRARNRALATQLETAWCARPIKRIVREEHPTDSDRKGRWVAYL